MFHYKQKKISAWNDQKPEKLTKKHDKRHKIVWDQPPKS